MALHLKQNTAVTLKIGPFLDSTDGSTAEGALTISQADVRLTKNGGAAAQKNDATAATHNEAGWYDCPLNTTDTNTLGILQLFVNETGALPVWHQFMVMPANVWDSLYGADALQVHAVEIANGLITAAAIATDAIDADAIAANAIDAGAIATGAITAAKFAAGAIDAAALAADAVTEIRSVASGTADSGTTTTMVDAARTEADTDYWKGNFILFTSGNISGQCRLITGFTPGTDTVTFTPATTQAVGTNTYEILPAGAMDLRLWNGTAPSSLIAGRVDANTQAMANDVITAAVIATGAIDADAIAADAITDAKVAADVTIASVTGAVASVTGNVGGNVTGSVGSVTGNVGGNVTGSVGSLAAQAQTDVKGQVVAALNTDTYAEPGVGAPAATTTLVAKIGYLYKYLRNRATSTGTTLTVYNDDGTTAAQQATHSDNGTTYDRGEWGSA